MFSALLLQLKRRIDEKRAGYVLIGAGVVYFVAFNTVLRHGDIWYFGFVLLVAVICGRLLLRRPTVTVVHVHRPGALGAGKSSLPAFDKRQHISR